MQEGEWFRDKLEQYRRDPEFRTELLLLAINEQLVSRMNSQGISRSELAERLQCSKAFVTKLLNGKPNLTMRTLVQIAGALDLAVDVNLRPAYLQYDTDWQRMEPCPTDDNDGIGAALRWRQMRFDDKSALAA